MNENNTTKLSLEILFLNDLRNSNAIDENIYNLAKAKLNTLKKEESANNKTVILATA